MAAEPSPAEQVKGLRLLSRILVGAGLAGGIGLPVVLHVMNVQIAMTSSGFDLFWLACLAIMLSDFGLAFWFARRAAAIERSIPPA